MTQCFTNLIKIQSTNFQSVKKHNLFCINLLDSCFSVVEQCVGEHIISIITIHIFFELISLTGSLKT